jgi:hypothetical protein
MDTKVGTVRVCRKDKYVLNDAKYKDSVMDAMSEWANEACGGMDSLTTVRALVKDVFGKTTKDSTL